MGHKRSRKKYVAKDNLRELLGAMLNRGLGRSRREDKKQGMTSDKIYSINTFRTYKNEGKKFLDWVKQFGVFKLKQGRKFINDYLQYLIDKRASPSSIKTARSALCKIYQLKAEDLISIPRRSRNLIKRSRRPTTRDKNISQETEVRLAKFTSATGLRRTEVMRICGTDLFFKDGRPWIRVTKGTKGGRYRESMILGETEEETQEIVKLFKEAGKMRLFPKWNTNFDNHHYRGTYAKRIYNHFALSEKELLAINQNDAKRIYRMRKDRAGQILDRQAMKITSEMLGHSRIQVIAQSYLY